MQPARNALRQSGLIAQNEQNLLDATRTERAEAKLNFGLLSDRDPDATRTERAEAKLRRRGRMPPNGSDATRMERAEAKTVYLMQSVTVLADATRTERAEAKPW